LVDQNERNRLLAEEFRNNGGRVSEEQFSGAALLLLTTQGRRSGKTYVNPLRYLEDQGRYIVFATHQGAPVDPDWFKNLMAADVATIEVDTDTLAVRPLVLTGEDRDALYRRQVALHPRFGEYETNTTRTIPVVALVPVTATT